MELRDYINVIRARKWVIVQAVVIVTLVAAVVSLVLPKSYEGTSEVLISNTSDAAAAILGSTLSQFSNQPERQLSDQVQMIQVRPVIEATIKRLNLQETPENLLKHVQVEAVGQTDLIKITVDDRNPATAAKIANAIADEYVQSARDAERASISDAADEVQKRLDDAQTQILDLGHKIAASGQSGDLQTELQIATETYSTLAEKLEQLRINEQLETGPGRVVSPAVVDTKAVSPRPVRNGALGVAVGLALGLGMAFLYEYLDNTVKSSEEIEKLLDAPVLGTIPLDKADKTEKGQRRRLAIIEAPGSSIAEAYRALRNSLDFVNFQNDIKTILVTSAAPGEGKSTVSSNLAVALAQAGKKVVLVSADFRRPTTDQFFRINNAVGLSDVLLGKISLKNALQRPDDTQLLVLSSGKMPPNPSELLSSEKMREVVKALGEWGEWVIIDAPPLLAVADPASVARWSDGVLMVSQAGVTTREAAKKAADLLGKVGARIVGVVVWGVDESKTADSYGHYTGGYYYYASYYAQSPAGKRVKGKEPEFGAPDSEHATPSSEDSEWILKTTPGRRAAIVIGRILSGALAFLVVIVIAALVAYLLAQYFHWPLPVHLSLPWG